MNDRLQVDSLGGHEREALREVEPNLTAKDAGGPRSGAVGLGCPMGIDVGKEFFELGVHGAHSLIVCG